MHRSVKRLSIALACILYFLVQSAYAPVRASQEITPGQWQQLTSDKAFSYKNDSEAVQPPIEYKPGAFAKAIQAFFSFWDSKEGNILLWILVSLGIAFIVYRVFFHKDSFLFGRNKKVMTPAGATADEDEHDLATTNWETLLHNALHNNDYRLAIRYSYMWMLQLMQQQGLIQYRNDKTNYEYYTELADTAYKQPFKKLSRDYEYAWYGRFELSHASYNEYKDLFDNIRKQMNA